MNAMVLPSHFFKKDFGNGGGGCKVRGKSCLPAGRREHFTFAIWLFTFNSI